MTPATNWDFKALLTIEKRDGKQKVTQIFETVDISNLSVSNSSWHEISHGPHLGHVPTMMNWKDICTKELFFSKIFCWCVNIITWFNIRTKTWVALGHGWARWSWTKSEISIGQGIWIPIKCFICHWQAPKSESLLRQKADNGRVRVKRLKVR